MMHELLRLLPQLGADELEVVLEVARGLIVGRQVYGPLVIDQDRRDFAVEALEEVRDGLVYIGAELVRMRREG